MVRKHGRNIFLKIIRPELKFQSSSLQDSILKIPKKSNRSRTQLSEPDHSNKEMYKTQLFINGKFVDPVKGGKFTNFNPISENDNFKILYYSALFICFFPFVPSGNFFNNWLSFNCYLPFAFIFNRTSYFNAKTK